MSAIHINTVPYKGWKKTIEISNSEIKILVVPATGRIMYYGFVGGENVLYENSALEGVLFNTGEYYNGNDEIQAPNVGGNRVLPCSEDYFHVLTGSRHIPDPFINASSYDVTFLKNGIVLESPISKILGVQIQRTITISGKGTGVNIQQELIKKMPAQNAAIEKIPLTIWSLSKIKTPNCSYFPIHKESIFKDGYFIPEWPDAKNNAAINVTTNSAILKIKSSETLPQKVGSDAKKWIAGFLEKTLFIEKFTFDEKGVYPDNGTSVTIFGNNLFTELECLSPEKTLQIGERISYDLHWSLYNVNDENEVNLIFKSL
jgi:hypothetical protein